MGVNPPSVQAGSASRHNGVVKGFLPQQHRLLDGCRVHGENSARERDTFWYWLKIEIPAYKLGAIARALRMTGVGDMDFTQDLDGLSRELQRRANLAFQDDKKERPPVA